jgi:LacI family transcriptional regulator
MRKQRASAILKVTGQASPRVVFYGVMEWGYCREILRGIRQYIAAHQVWRLRLVKDFLGVLSSEVASPANRTVGVIGTFASPDELGAACNCGVPVVNVSSRSASNSLPSVNPDNVAVGRLGAQHFMDSGFRQFAFVGYREHRYSSERLEGFRQALREAGLESRLHEMEWREVGVDVLRAMPRPVGLMTANDHAAYRLLGRIDRAGLRVPEDIAVLGADNDDMLCEVADVPLSSVDPDFRRVGYEAARLLAGLIDGQPSPASPLVVAPAGVVTRASTDLVAVEDPAVATALRYIHEHACDPMVIKEMIGQTGISRRTLETRFRARFGRTLHGEIRRVQFQRAQRLLAETDLDIPNLARACGISDSKRFSRMFHQQFGVSPSGYRRQLRAR